MSSVVVRNILPHGSSVLHPKEHNGNQKKLSSDTQDFHCPIYYIQEAVNRKPLAGQRETVGLEDLGLKASFANSR